MSTLHAILFFGGIPLLIIAALVMLVWAPSLVKGPRYRPGQPFDAAPAIFGSGSDLEAPRQLTPGSDTTEADDADSTGGASVRW